MIITINPNDSLSSNIKPSNSNNTMYITVNASTKKHCAVNEKQKRNSNKCGCLSGTATITSGIVIFWDLAQRDRITKPNPNRNLSNLIHTNLNILLTRTININTSNIRNSYLGFQVVDIWHSVDLTLNISSNSNNLMSR